MFRSRFMPCDECGDSIDRHEQAQHVCDGDRLLDLRMFELRGEVARFEAEFAAYLATPAGRFESWYARTRSAG